MTPRAAKTAELKPPAGATAEALDDARRQRLGTAIREARGDIPQADFGIMLGGVPQTTVSRWERGLVEMTITQLVHIETALKLKGGTILRQAGLIEDDGASKSIEDLLRSDPHIHPDLRADAVTNYRAMVRYSSRMAANDERQFGPRRRARTGR